MIDILCNIGIIYIIFVILDFSIDGIKKLFKKIKDR